MYNKAKRILSIIAGVFHIVVGVFSCLCALCNLGFVEFEPGFIVFTMINVGFGVPFIVLGSKLIKFPARINGAWDSRKKIHLPLIICMAIFLFYSLLAIEFSYGGGFILLIEELAEYEDAAFLADDIFMLLFFHLFNAVFAVYALAVNCVAMGMKTQKGQYIPEAPARKPVNDSVFAEFESKNIAATISEKPAQGSTKNIDLDAKVKQLKQWKENGTITESQYNDTMNKLLNGVVDGSIACAADENVEGQVRKLFAEVLALREEQIGADANFFDDLGGSSLDYLMLSDAISTKYGVDIKDVEDRSLHTLADICAYIKSK